MLPLLTRGIAAGGLGGLLSGLFSLLLAGPVLDRAIRLEEEHGAEHAGAAQAHAHAAEEVFGRGTQHVGLVVTAVVMGLALGVFFGIVHAVLYRVPDPAADWQRAVTLAAAGFVALSLLPGLRYPARPPGVGDGDTVEERQLAWVAAMVIGVLGTALAWHLYRRLADRLQPVRQFAVAGTLVATLAALFLLPGNPDPVEVPAELLWDFRLLSLTGHGLLWAGLAVAFWLFSRAAATATAAATTTAGTPGVTAPAPAETVGH
ncbi:CbtA family protein [Streptomyces sp. URMC 129]|uniref:CbtA family protein n=1 Tax=Streptomyces sp. URMC 129 TaxID=3423407 RepID=UPI003F1DC32F